MKPVSLLLLWVLFLSFLNSQASAQHAGHSQSGHGASSSPSSPKVDSSMGQETSRVRAFLLEGEVKASFSIMTLEEHKKMLRDMKMKVEVDPKATHNIAVVLTDTRSNQPIHDGVVKIKVISPQGKEEVRLLDSIPAMKQFVGDFTLNEKGRYQILVLFKAKGKKHATGFYYRLP